MPASNPLRRLIAGHAAAAALLFGQAAHAQGQIDPDNPTCPQSPNWSSYPEMRFTLEEIDGRSILLAEGRIDDNVVSRLQAALDRHPVIDEIWIRSPGGSARAGNQAGRIIRETGIPTRIPSGWACFSACNFMFMGGAIRYVDPDGLFIVHMFTHTGDRDAIRSEVSRGVDNTIGLIGDIEQQSALLASEDNDFLIRMGISRLLLTEVMYRTRAVAGQGGDRSTRRCLTQQEVNRYNVATVAWTG
ncbi:MAG: hypothetical protein M3N07_08625 [Pseudomonadota bacterium]|nr:hypothetical protein [Pseudomonadota bacterium]